MGKMNIGNADICIYMTPRKRLLGELFKYDRTGVTKQSDPHRITTPGHYCLEKVTPFPHDTNSR